jgi:hypothetical protein
MGGPIVHFTTSSAKVCPRASLNFFSLPKRSRYSMPRSFIPLLHSGRVCYLFPNIPPLGAPHTTLPLVRCFFTPRSPILLPNVLPGPLLPCPLHGGGSARRVNHSMAAANLCRDPSTPEQNRSLAAAVSLAPLFRLSGVISQYYRMSGIVI